MQIPNITQFVRDYLVDRPELLKKYVDLGIITANYALIPVNAFMRHLILVQGLNPDISVREMLTPQFTQELSRAFDHIHTSHANNEYDHMWAAHRFEKVREKLNLTRDQFDAYTDVSKLQSIPVPDVKVMESSFGTDIPLIAESNPVNELAAVVETLSKIADTLDIEANPVDATLFLDEEPSPDPKELFSRTDHLRDVKKIIEQYGSVYGKLGQQTDCEPRKIRNSSAGNGKARAHKKVPTTKVVKKSKRSSFTRSPRKS